LQNKYGHNKFIHTILDFSKLRDNIFFHDFQEAATEKDFRRVNICPACVLAMHIETIVYCLKNHITHVSDGANIETGQFPWQTQTLANLIEFRDFYNLFGLEYIINPNYYHHNSDNALNTLGIISRTNVRRQYSYRKSTQQFCIPIHMQSICRRLHGRYNFRSEENALISRYFNTKITKYQSYIHKRIGSEQTYEM
jgi:hypothetical protein